MSLSCKVGSLTVPGATGNQAYSGLGFTPKVVLFFGVRRSSDGVDGTGPNMAMTICGIAVSSTARAVLYSTDDFSGGGYAVDATKAIFVRHYGIGTPVTDYAADLVTLDADGFTLNWTTANATAYVVNYMALGGGDLTNVFLKSLTTPTATGSQGYTGVGFRPDALLLIGAGINDSAPDANHDTAAIGFGSSSTARGCVARGFNGALIQYQRTDKIYADMDGGAGATIQRQCDLTSLDADGFTLNWDTAVAAQHTVYVLCLKGGQFKAGAFLQKTSTGSQGYSGVGFQPTGIVRSSFFEAATTSVLTNRIYGDFGAASGATARATSHFGDANAAVAVLDRTKFIRLESDAGTPVTTMAADLTSFDADGFTLNWTTADATARQSIYLAFGSAPIPPYEQEGYRWRNDDGSESTATWLAAQDTDTQQPTGQNLRLRMLVNAAGDPPSQQYQLEWRKVGTSTWRTVK